jgi:predicted NBD/HSP70 family sugar kinase
MRRSDLASHCGIRKSSVTSLANELLAQRVLCNELPERPRSPLKFERGQWFAIGVSIGVEAVTFARIDLTGEMFGKFSRPLGARTSGRALLEVVLDGLLELRRDSAHADLGVGIALPGIINPLRGTCSYSINIPQLNDTEVGSFLSKNLGEEVRVENDARASLWSAIWFERLPADYRNVIYLDITSGVGSALLINGVPHAGSTFSAGELGHLKAGDENRACRCGKVDCLETYCSIDALRRDIAGIAPELGSLGSASEIAAAAAGNIVVLNVLDRAMERMSGLLSVLVAYVDPEVILLGNQDPAFYETLVPILRKHLCTRLQGCGAEALNIQVVPSAEDSALRGMAGLIFDRAFREWPAVGP